jgi:hypothetical protein
MLKIDWKLNENDIHLLMQERSSSVVDEFFRERIFILEQ